MITKFFLEKEELVKLSNFTSHGKDIVSNSVSICLPDIANNKLTMLFLGGNDDFSAKFVMNIVEASSDIPAESLNYFLVNISELSTTLLKVIGLSEKVQVTVSGDVTTSTIIRNNETNTEISIVNHDKLTENKVKKIIQLFEDYKSCFKDSVYKITPTTEFIDIMSIICKSMKASGYELNSAMINHNKIKYCDPQGIMEYTLQDDVSPYDKDIYIQDCLVKYLSSFLKDNVVLILDESNTYAYIETSNGLTLITSLSENVFQYPSDEEIDIVGPGVDSNITVQINRTDLINALGTFDGVFRSELWKWASLVFDSSKENISNNQIFLSHEDSNARASTILPVQLVSNTDTSETCKFLIGSSYIKDILSKMSDDVITMTYSSGDIGTPHGTGFILQDSKLKVVCIKIIDSDA